MKTHFNKIFVFLCASIISIFLLAESVFAFFPVIDITNLVQNVLQVVKMAASNAQSLQQIANQIAQVKQGVTNLKNLGASEFAAIQSLLNGNINALNTIIADVNGINYNMNNITTQYDSLYPAGWNDANLNQYQTYRSQWITAAKNSQQDAMRAQSVLSDIKTSNQKVAGILFDSHGAEGTIGQIQATNQLLTQVSNQMGTMTQVLAVTARMDATAQAQQSSQEAASQQIIDKSLTAFTNQDNTPAPYPNLPLIK